MSLALGEYSRVSFLNLLGFLGASLGKQPGPAPQADFPGRLLKRPLLSVFFPFDPVFWRSPAKTGDKAVVEWDGPATAR